MDKPTLRLLDANFNRAREALRVLEDFARFILDDVLLTRTAKQIRHDLSLVVAQVPSMELLLSRDTPGDVGTTISTADERSRTDVPAVAHAAAKRLTEALRCLEEYFKIDHPLLAARIETIRYQCYDLEKHISLLAHRKEPFRHVRLYVLLTEAMAKRPLLEVAEQAIAGGADCLQLREKDKPDRAILELALPICRLCRDAGVLFMMNDRPDLAVLADADGLHLGQDDLSVAEARKILKPNQIVGKSVHNLTEANDAVAEQPDYLAVGAVFPSPSKPTVPTVRPELITQIRKIYHGPIVAIGGITDRNASLALEAGATALAVCDAVLTAENPQTATRTIRNLISASIPSDVGSDSSDGR